MAKREWSLEEIKRLIDQGGGGGGAVNSVNGKTGNVVLVPSDLGLGNVDNTHDNVKNVASAATAGKLANARKIELSGEVTGDAQFDGSGDINITTTLGVPYVSSVNGQTGDINITQPNTITLTGDATGTATFDTSGNVTINTTVSGGGAGGPAVTYVNSQSEMTDNKKIYSLVGATDELYHPTATSVDKIFPIAATPLYMHQFTIKRAGRSLTLQVIDQNQVKITDTNYITRMRKAVSYRVVTGDWQFDLIDGTTKNMGLISFFCMTTGTLELVGCNFPNTAGENIIIRRQQFTKSTYSMMNDDTVTTL